ncbi:lipocalin family protein [Hymenobacter koreensis]|uniref:Lipocalin family protein n=1 Tax=Hymenobacter koreensis TaxID=1084523 RepID=A0ABP8J121_9BACT
MQTPKTRRPVLVGALLAAVAAGGAAYAYSQRRAPLATVHHVNLSRYAGLWYEIARLPQYFEKGCHYVTAEYRPLADGRLEVINTCHKGEIHGPVKKARGVARAVDPQTNAKLKVQFQWPFEGDYWILALDPEYQFALVGSPDRKGLWILSRTPHMPLSTRRTLVTMAQGKGFPVDKLIYTDQPAGPLT